MNGVGRILGFYAVSGVLKAVIKTKMDAMDMMETMDTKMDIMINK